MGYNFLPYRPEQMLLLPPSLADWVPEGSLARFVSDLVDDQDAGGRLASFYAPRREDGCGRAAFHPRMMVKVLLYSYCVGVTSSRRIAQAVEDNVALRYLTANLQPRFRAIADFRAEHREALERLFVDVLRLCAEAGLAKLGRVAIDGRRVPGNAALDRNRTQESLDREVRDLEGKVAELLEEAERRDAEEDKAYGPEARGDELPRELRTKKERLQRLKEARDRLEEKARVAREEQAQKIADREREEAETGQKKRGRKPRQPEEAVDKAAKANTTDPDSRILKTRKGYVQGYNGQAAADCESQVIVAQDVTQQENDVQQLAPMLQRCEEQAGQKPKQALADAGYWSDDNAVAGGEETELFIATQKDHKQRKALQERAAPRGRIPKNASLRERMERKLLTKRGKTAYRQRGASIEAVFGQMSTRGLTRFLMRGVEKVRMEWSLWCTTHNILKLWRSGWRVAAQV